MQTICIFKFRIPVLKLIFKTKTIVLLSKKEIGNTQLRKPPRQDRRIKVVRTMHAMSKDNDLFAIVYF